jgi:hypothetical protein
MANLNERARVIYRQRCNSLRIAHDTPVTILAAAANAEVHENTNHWCHVLVSARSLGCELHQADRATEIAERIGNSLACHTWFYLESPQMKTGVVIFAALCASGAALGQTLTSGGAYGTGAGPVRRNDNIEHSAPKAVRPGEPVDRLAAELGLDAGQRAQLKLLLDVQHTKIDRFIAQQLAAGKQPSVQLVQSLLAHAQAETLRKLTALLSAKQLQTLADLGGPSNLAGAPDRISMRISPADEYCDSTGKCVAL